jgi:hypothetical protein
VKAEVQERASKIDLHLAGILDYVDNQKESPLR